MFEWRNLVCGVMVVLVPGSLVAQGTDRALLHSDGGTWINGSPAPETSTIFLESLIQTQKGHSAKLDTEGSSVIVQPETVVQFEGDELVLDHGSLQLTTMREMKVRVNCITVIPITADRTLYEVSDIDGKVTVVASKNDVKVHAQASAFRKAKTGESSDAIVREGEQKTRDEHCVAAAKPIAGLDANGPILNSTAAKIAGVVAVGVITCFALCRGDEPISPDKP